MIVPVDFARCRNQNDILKNMILIKYFLEEQNWLLFKCATFLKLSSALLVTFSLHLTPMKIIK